MQKLGCRMRFEPTISVGEWPQTYSPDRATTGTGKPRCVSTVNVDVSLREMLKPRRNIIQEKCCISTFNKQSIFLNPFFPPPTVQLANTSLIDSAHVVGKVHLYSYWPLMFVQTTVGKWDTLAKKSTVTF